MIKEQLVEYLQNTFLFEFDDNITVSTDLFGAGLIDSHGYIQLMSFIQKNFAVKFSRSELLSNVIASLSGLVAAVEAKLEAQSVPMASGSESRGV